MWPEDKGLLMPCQVVLRSQLINKGLQMNGPGLPPSKAAHSDKEGGLALWSSSIHQHLVYSLGKVKSPGVPRLSSLPLSTAFSSHMDAQ